MDHLNRFPQMLQIELMRRVREVEEAGRARKARLHTRDDVLAYQAETALKVRRCLGRFPLRTPLNVRVTGTLQRDGYQVEKLLFESRPGLVVSALLYLPSDRRFPVPAVLGTCGHSMAGKAEPAYQAFCQGLVRKGYAVLIYDPIGQGERTQWPAGAGYSAVGDCCAEHNLLGAQQLLVGEWFGSWRIWDGIRALDYLLSRPEVDRRHIGLTGNSGGGTMTTWLLATDRRFTMGAPGCYVTTWRRNAENELPADIEQQPPHALALGLDVDDFLALHAPKPLAILSQELDFFDLRGAREVHERLRRVYRLLGAPQNLEHFVGQNEHGYTQPLREAMYRCLNRACGKQDEGDEQPPVIVEKEEDLWATPEGTVSAVGGRPVYTFTATIAQRLQRARTPLCTTDLQHALKQLLALPRHRGAPEYRILRPLGRQQAYPRPYATCYAVQTAPGIEALVTHVCEEPLSAAPRPGSSAVLYVPHLSADADLREEPLARELAAHSTPFFAVDLRGLGESTPNTCGPGDPLHLYGADYFYASYELMFETPTVSQRTHDLLVVCDWLAGFGYGDLHLVGRGLGSVPATFGALFGDAVTAVTLKNAPISFTEWAQAEKLRWPLSSVPPGVLRRFDLPDCYAALEGKRLRMIEPWDASMGKRGG